MMTANSWHNTIIPGRIKINISHDASVDPEDKTER